MSWEGAFDIPERLECANAAKEPRVLQIRVEVVHDSGDQIHHYYLKPLDPPVSTGEVYFAGFREVRKGLLQVTDLTNPLPAPYQRCGITRALIRLVAQRHNSNVRSSKAQLGDREQRSDDATRVWQRMVEAGLARYNAKEDRYYYTLGD